MDPSGKNGPNALLGEEKFQKNLVQKTNKGLSNGSSHVGSFAH